MNRLKFLQTTGVGLVGLLSWNIFKENTQVCINTETSINEDLVELTERTKRQPIRRVSFSEGMERIDSLIAQGKPVIWVDGARSILVKNPKRSHLRLTRSLPRDAVEAANAKFIRIAPVKFSDKFFCQLIQC